MKNRNNNENLVWDEELIELKKEYDKLSDKEKEQLENLLLSTLSDLK